MKRLRDGSTGSGQGLEPVPSRTTARQAHAHVGGAAAEASAAMGATAYATADHVAFASAPDLHTAAHEAAHTVQQRGGVQLKGGVGKVGDVYERHADAVADKVVAGESAATLLDEMSGSGGGSVPAQIQRKDIGGSDGGQDMTAWDLSAERFRAEAERRGAQVTAREYVRGYMLTKIAPALSAAMTTKGFPPPAPRLSWGERASDFGFEIVARIPDAFADEYHGLPDPRLPSRRTPPVPSSRSASTTRPAATSGPAPARCTATSSRSTPSTSTR